MEVKEKFKRFHRANPHVFELFERFAQEALDSGATRLSSKWIIERIRWETMIKTSGHPFKIDNRYTAWYARLYALKHPKRKNLFETRQIKTK